MTTPIFWQTAFRVRNDDNDEVNATWRQTQGTNDTVGKDLNFRVRFLIDEQNSGAWTSQVFNLYYSKNGGAYAAVTGSTPVFFSLSSHFADGNNCTSQLTGGTGTFLSANAGMKETTGGATNSGSKNNYFEVEFCLQLDEAQMAADDYVDLRIYNGTSALGNYSSTPRITYTSVSTVEETASALIKKGVSATTLITGGNALSASRSLGVSATTDPMTDEHAVSTNKVLGTTIQGGMVIEETLYDIG